MSSDNALLRQCRERLEKLKKESSDQKLNTKVESKDSDEASVSPNKRQCSVTHKVLKTMEGDVSLVKESVQAACVRFNSRLLSLHAAGDLGLSVCFPCYRWIAQPAAPLLARAGDVGVQC